MSFPEIFSSEEIDKKLEILRQGGAEHLAKQRPMELRKAWAVIDAHRPNIHNRLKLIWGSPECSKYLSSLIISNKDNRAGFKLLVLDAFLVLANEHALIITPE